MSPPTTYSMSSITCMILQSISLILLGMLMHSILVSKHHFTKWTLFQMCISTFVNNVCRLLLNILFDDTPGQQETQAILIIQKIATYAFFPLVTFPLVVAFYLWYALVKGDMRIERRCIYYLSGAIWAYAIVHTTSFLVDELRGREYADLKFYTIVIPIIVATLFSIAILCHSSLILWQRWRNHNNRQNRTTAIKLGHATRLFVFCFVYIVILMSGIVPRTLSYAHARLDRDYKTLTIVTNFSSASIGVLLFSVFGTTKKAAVFLPCCYYVPPASPTLTSSFSSFNDNNERVTMIPAPTAMSVKRNSITVTGTINHVPMIENVYLRSVKGRRIAEYECKDISVKPTSEDLGNEMISEKSCKIAERDSMSTTAVSTPSTIDGHFESEASSVDNIVNTAKYNLKLAKEKCNNSSNTLVVYNENIEGSTNEDYSFINFYLN